MECRPRLINDRRWCFWLNVIVCGVSLILFAFCYHPPNFQQLKSGMKRREQLKRIDYGGFVLYMGGLICLLLALCRYSYLNPGHRELPVVAWGGK